MIKKLAFILLSFLFVKFQAQHKEIDSLLHLARATGHDSVKLNAYLKICDLCEVKDNLKFGKIADSLAERLIAKAKSENERKRFIESKLLAYSVIKVYYESAGNFDSVKKYSEAKVEISERTKDKNLIHEQLENLAEVFRRSNKYSEAMEVYTKKLKKAESAGDTYDLLFLFRGISTTYSRMHNNNKALEYELKRLKLIQRTTKDSADVAWEYIDVGQKYYNLYDHERANVFYLKAYKLLENRVDERQQIYLLFQLARSFNEIKKKQRGERIFFQGA
jgi:tetratricopeptide (TPR) repeat protein